MVLIKEQQKAFEQSSIPCWGRLKPARLCWPGLVPSVLALAVETVGLVTVFTGAWGVSEPSTSLPGGQGRVSIGIGLSRWRGCSLLLGQGEYTEEVEEVLEARKA